MRTDRRGIALLEVLAALTLLAIAGLTLTAVLRNSLAVHVRAVAAERELREAHRVLTAMTLLRREDLVRRIGVQRVGTLTVAVSRPEQALYRIASADTLAPDEALLVTVVHRVEPGS